MVGHARLGNHLFYGLPIQVKIANLQETMGYKKSRQLKIYSFRKTNLRQEMVNMGTL